MSRRHRRGGMVDRPKASIDMNSLIDLTFLLLVTFILTIPALEQGISIILPRGKTDTLQVKEHKPATITIDAENRYFLDKSPTTLEALEKELLAKVAADPESPVLRRGDGCRQARVQVQGQAHVACHGRKMKNVKCRM